MNATIGGQGLVAAGGPSGKRDGGVNGPAMALLVRLDDELCVGIGLTIR